jgi:hypothetical protein
LRLSRPPWRQDDFLTKVSKGSQSLDYCQPSVPHSAFRIPHSLLYGSSDNNYGSSDKKLAQFQKLWCLWLALKGRTETPTVSTTLEGKNRIARLSQQRQRHPPEKPLLTRAKPLRQSINLLRICFISILGK